jgi:peptide-methionine (R)-S-oxide reductase
MRLLLSKTVRLLGLAVAWALFVSFVGAELYLLVQIHKSSNMAACGHTFCRRSFSGFLAFLVTFGAFVVMAGVATLIASFLVPLAFSPDPPPPPYSPFDDVPQKMGDDEWRARLTSEQFAVLRGRESNPSPDHPLIRETGSGTYHCAGCGTPVFGSEAKSSPNSWQAREWLCFSNAVTGAIRNFPAKGYTFGRFNETIGCRTCGCHLGHYFPGKRINEYERYLISPVALNFSARP